MKSLSILFAVAFGSSMTFVGCGTEGDNSPMLSSADTQDDEALGLSSWCEVNAQNQETGICITVSSPLICSGTVRQTGCIVGKAVNPAYNKTGCPQSFKYNTAMKCVVTQ